MGSPEAQLPANRGSWLHASTSLVTTTVSPTPNSGLVVVVAPRPTAISNRKQLPPSQPQQAAAQQTKKQTDDEPSLGRPKFPSARLGNVQREARRKVGETGWLTKSPKLSQMSGSSSTGEREKRTKKRRRKLLPLLLFPLVVGCWTSFSLAKSLSDNENAEESPARSDILETSQRQTSLVGARAEKEFGCSPTDSYTDNNNNNNNNNNNSSNHYDSNYDADGTGRRRLLLLLSESERESESDTDSGDNDNETDNGSENDNDGSTNNIDDGDNADNRTAPATARPSGQLLVVTRLPDERPPTPAAPSEAQEEPLDDSADDYNDYGAYVIYENDLDEQSANSSPEAASNESGRSVPMAAATATAAANFQQVFYAGRRSSLSAPLAFASSPISSPSGGATQEQARRRRRLEVSNQRALVSNSSTSRQLPKRTTIASKGESGRDEATKEEKSSDDDNDDVKWLSRMMIMSEATSSAKSRNGQSNQTDLAKPSDIKQRQKQKQQQQNPEAEADAEVTNKSFQFGGPRQEVHSSMWLNSNSSQRSSQEEFLEKTDEQSWRSDRLQEKETKVEHNVYYWRLIWFVLPVGATFGNLLVIMAVYLEKSLQSVTNYFIVSLAFADLFVGLIVMPFAVYVLVNEVWELSDAICDIYVAVDVTSSTASILNLVAISIDRYRAVAHPIAYSARTSSTRAILTILLVWFISCCVGAPIILGLNTSQDRNSNLCILYNSTFIFWSSLTSFYVPCIIMIGLYWRIFLAIRSRTKKAIQAGTHAPPAAAALAAVAHHLHHSSSIATAAAAAAAAATTKATLANHKSSPESTNSPKEPTQAVATNQRQSNLLEADTNEIILSGAKLQTAHALPGEKKPQSESASKLPAADAHHQSISASAPAQPTLRPQRQELVSASFTNTFARRPNEPTRTTMSSVNSPEAKQSQQPRVSGNDRQVNGSDPMGSKLFPEANGMAGSVEVVPAIAKTIETTTSTSHSNQSKTNTSVQPMAVDANCRRESVVCPLAKRIRSAQTSNTRSAQHLIDQLRLRSSATGCNRDGKNNNGTKIDHDDGDGSGGCKEVTVRLAIERLSACCCGHSEQMNIRDGGSGGGTCLRDFFLPSLIEVGHQMSSSLIQESFPVSRDVNRCCDSEWLSSQHPPSSKPFSLAASLCPPMVALLISRRRSSLKESQCHDQLVEARLSLTPVSNEINIEFCADSWFKNTDEKDEVHYYQQSVDESIEETVREVGRRLNSLSSKLVEITEILHYKCRASKSDMDTTNNCDHVAKIDGTCCNCCRTKLTEGERLNGLRSADLIKKQAGSIQSVCISIESETHATSNGAGKVLLDQVTILSRANGLEQLQIYLSGQQISSPSCRRITWLNGNYKFRSPKFRLRIRSPSQQLCAACTERCLIGSSFRVEADRGDSAESDINLFKPKGEQTADGGDPKATRSSSCSWAMIDSRNPRSTQTAQVAQVSVEGALRKIRQTSLIECSNLSKLLEEERIQQIKSRTVSATDGSRVNYCPSYAGRDDQEEDDDDDDDDDEEEDDEDEDEDEDEEEDEDEGLAGPTSGCRFSRSSSTSSRTNHNHDHESHSWASSRSSLSSGSECSASRRNHYDSRRSSHPSCCQPSPTCLACQRQQTNHQISNGAASKQNCHQSGDLEFTVCQHSRASATELTPTSGSKSRKNTLSALSEQDGATSTSATCRQKQANDELGTAKNVIQSATLKLKRRSIRLGKFLRQTTLKTAGLVDNQSVSVAPSGIKTQSSEDRFSSSILATNVPTNALFSVSPSNFSMTNNPPQTSSSTGGQLNPSTGPQAGSLMSPSASMLASERKSSAIERTEPSSCSRNLDEGENKSRERPRDRRNKSTRRSKIGDDESLERQIQQKRDIKQSFLVASVINLIQQQQHQKSAGERASQRASQKRSQRSKKSNDGQVVASNRQHRAGGSRRRREKNAARRERKATKTLAIVLGIFLICWTPFFTCNIIDGICIQLNMDCRPGMMVYLVTSWLGYINSCVNPIIYTIFNMEFRRAFKRILKSISCC